MLKKILILNLLLLITACGTSPKTHFYLLASDNYLTDQHLTENNKSQIAVGLWKIKLPDYLDRSEIISRSGLYTIELADFHHWAGGFENNVNNLLLGELKYQLKSDKVALSPWPFYVKNNYQIKLEITEYAGMLGGENKLIGSWLLLNAKGNKQLQQFTFNYSNKTAEKSHKAMVSNLSQLIQQLAEDMAKEISLIDAREALLTDESTS